MKTVLIVEDMKDYSDCLAMILSRKGYNVVVADTGVEGLQKAVSVKPDLILMDLFMPDQDGAETVARIRQHQSLAEVPIVFLTALTFDESTETDTIKVQGRGYPAISKMANQDVIIGKVREALGD